MKAVEPRSIFELLSRKRLLRVADEIGMDVDRRALAPDLVEALVAANLVGAADLVELLTAPEWADLCQAHGVSKRATDRGRRQPSSRAQTLGLHAGDETVGWGGALEIELATMVDSDRCPRAAGEGDRPPQGDSEVKGEGASGVAVAVAVVNGPERRRLRARARLFIDLMDVPGPELPVTRGDCVDGPRPCPWLRCRHHLDGDRKLSLDEKRVIVRYADAHGVTPAARHFQCTTGMIYGWRDEVAVAPEPDPSRRWGHLPIIPRETCALDIAARGAQTMEAVGEELGICRERVRQIEVQTYRKPRVRAAFREIAG
jgi:hypothetical protein